MKIEVNQLPPMKNGTIGVPLEELKNYGITNQARSFPTGTIFEFPDTLNPEVFALQEVRNTGKKALCIAAGVNGVIEWVPMGTFRKPVIDPLNALKPHPVNLELYAFESDYERANTCISKKLSIKDTVEMNATRWSNGQLVYEDGRLATKKVNVPIFEWM